MIIINKELQLQPILSKDVFILQNLMKDIYPFAYKHFWRDSGNFYINSQYSKENIIKELSQEKTEYYFIVFNKEIIGNLRVIWGAELKNLAIKRQVKLHRIYLHPKTHNKGLGKTILSWLETEAKNKGYKALWLDAMVEQEDSFKFYKKRGFIYHSHIHLDFELMYDDFKKMSQIYKLLS